MRSTKNNALAIFIPEKNDAYSRIQKFMSNEESGITLSPKEENMLSRWIYANGMLSEKKFTEDEIAEKIKDKFSVSIYTARNDINYTYRLFARVTNDYKRYTLKHHIEFLQQRLQLWKTDKSMAAFIPKLSDSITKAIAAMPAEIELPDIPPPVIIVSTTRDIKPKMSPEEALKEADAIIEYEKTQEYIEFEEVNKEDGNTQT